MIARINKNIFIFFFIMVVAFFFRVYGINWDSGFHFHPDERMLIMVADRIRFWSQMNPDFFNYGSLPVYLLVGASQLIDRIIGSAMTNYDGLLFVGRWLSLISDLIVLILVYKISAHLFQNKSAALWSAFFYAIAFFPIQNSHFFIVDTFLNLFSTLLIYQLLLFQLNPSYRRIIFIGITFAAALTSKISAVIFLPIILMVLLYPHPLTILKKDLLRLVLFSLITVIFSALFMPYAFIEHERFVSDIQQQIKMNSDAYIFPYTLQYVGTLPYWYYMRNIFLWGLGPIISIFTLIGIAALISKLRIHHLKFELLQKKHLLFGLFYLIYFLIIGKSAVKFMRYMLLMYPFFAVMAGYGIVVILNSRLPRLCESIAGRCFRILKDADPPAGRAGRRSIFFSRFRIKSGMTMIIILPTLLWTFMFVNIYSTPNTRIQATQWINQFIPYGSVLGVEHWDDRVPIYDPGNYQYEELTLYDIPDDAFKWNILQAKLDRSDYIILASNRLYTPLQKLDDCETTYPRCYPLTSTYYQKLLSNKLGFVKVAEFTSYPRLEIGPPTGGWKLEINDSSSDESFTVYDHPKIMIFKKI